MGNGFKVKAIREGFHGEGLKKEGDTFNITNARDFSSRWMKDLTKDQDLAELAAKDKAEYLAKRDPVKPVGVTAERKDEIEAEVRAEFTAGLQKELEAKIEADVREKILAEIDEAQKADGGSEVEDNKDGELSESQIADIKVALEMLSDSNDAHWTKAGLPEVSVVTGLFNDNSVILTRALLNEIAPDCARKQVV